MEETEETEAVDSAGTERGEEIKGGEVVVMEGGSDRDREGGREARE